MTIKLVNKFSEKEHIRFDIILPTIRVWAKEINDFGESTNITDIDLSTRLKICSQDDFVGFILIILGFGIDFGFQNL